MSNQANVELMSITQASKYMGVTRATIYAWMKEYPAFPHCRVGKHTRIPRYELDVWMGRYKCEPQPLSIAKIRVEDMICPISDDKCSKRCAWLTVSGCAVAVLAGRAVTYEPSCEESDGEQ